MEDRAAETGPSRLARLAARGRALEERLEESAYAPFLARLVRWTVFLAVLFVIYNHLSEIGWGTIRAALPANPLFYAVIILAYGITPLTDAVIYRVIWGAPIGGTLPATLRKRVLNEGVMGYSGELYFCFWARRALAVPARKAVMIVKDVNILSAIVSTSAAAGLSGWMIATGRLGDILPNPDAWEVGIIVFFVLLSIFLFLNFRFHFFALARHLMVQVLGLHYLRLIAVNLFLLLVWSIAMPHVPAATWATILAAQMLATRVPFLPNQELVLLGIGVGLSSRLDVPGDKLAALFLAYGAVMMALHAALYVATTLMESSMGRAAAETE
jgi:hypothetical protein